MQREIYVTNLDTTIEILSSTTIWHKTMYPRWFYGKSHVFSEWGYQLYRTVDIVETDSMMVSRGPAQYGHLHVRNLVLQDIDVIPMNVKKPLFVYMSTWTNTDCYMVTYIILSGECLTHCIARWENILNE